jgi:hypothetical protein
MSWPLHSYDLLLVIRIEFQSFPTTSFLLVNFVKKIIIIFIHFEPLFYFSQNTQKVKKWLEVDKNYYNFFHKVNQ